MLVRFIEPSIPLIHTGKIKIVDYTYYGFIETAHQFREQITPKNKNWCNGGLVWASARELKFLTKPN